MASLWGTTEFCIFVACLAFWIGDILDFHTHGLLATMVVGGIIFIIGYVTGFFPRDFPSNLGIGKTVAGGLTFCLLANMGSTMDINKFIEQWKVVVSALFSILVLCLVIIPLGTALFSREMAWASAAPISGGAVAAMLTEEVTEAAGRSDLTAFVALICIIQVMFGMPVSGFFLRKYCRKVIADKSYLTYEAPKYVQRSFRIFKPVRKEYDTKFLAMWKYGLVGLLAKLIANAIGWSSGTSIFVLLLGTLFTELGFLEKNAFSKQGLMNFFTICFYINLVDGFHSLTGEMLLSQIVPLIVLLGAGIAAAVVGFILIGKFAFKMDWRLCAALAPACTFGFPFSQFLSEDIVSRMDLPKEDEEKLLSMVEPAMVISGFTTVTVASVALASILGPMIFAA